MTSLFKRKEKTGTSADLPLDGKVAIVTGGSQGIGRAISLLLAEQGASVVVNYSRSEAPALEVVKEINSSGTERAIAIKANAGAVPEIKTLVTETVQKFGKIDILVANAGKIYGNKGLANTSEADFDEAFDLNVKGVFFLVQEAAPHIPDNGGRVILFSSSLTGNSMIPPSYLLYNATKGAIEQMSRILAKDLGKRGVTVNTVSPGPTATDGFFEGKTEDMLKMIRGWHPSGDIGKPEHIAETVAFLASPASQWVNGQNIRVNGGAVV